MANREAHDARNQVGFLECHICIGCSIYLLKTLPIEARYRQKGMYLRTQSLTELKYP